jgi:type II secretory pathway pseudopilin PulG
MMTVPRGRPAKARAIMSERGFTLIETIIGVGIIVLALTMVGLPLALAPSIENARLYEELHGQLRELQETEAQLLQAARLATLGTLASGVAYEISNPLFSILGRVELLLDDSRRHLRSEKAPE